MIRSISLFTLVKGKKTFYIKEIPVKDHYIFYIKGQRHGKSYLKGKLVGEETLRPPVLSTASASSSYQGAAALLGTGDWGDSTCCPDSMYYPK